MAGHISVSVKIENDSRNVCSLLCHRELPGGMKIAQTMATVEPGRSRMLRSFYGHSFSLWDGDEQLQEWTFTAARRQLYQASSPLPQSYTPISSQTKPPLAPKPAPTAVASNWAQKAARLHERQDDHKDEVQDENKNEEQDDKPQQCGGEDERPPAHKDWRRPGPLSRQPPPESRGLSRQSDEDRPAKRVSTGRQLTGVELHHKARAQHLPLGYVKATLHKPSAAARLETKARPLSSPLPSAPSSAPSSPFSPASSPWTPSSVAAINTAPLGPWSTAAASSSSGDEMIAKAKLLHIPASIRVRASRGSGMGSWKAMSWVERLATAEAVSGPEASCGQSDQPTKRAAIAPTPYPPTSHVKAFIGLTSSKEGSMSRWAHSFDQAAVRCPPLHAVRVSAVPRYPPPNIC